MNDALHRAVIGGLLGAYAPVMYPSGSSNQVADATPGTLKIMIGGLRFFYRRTCGLDWKTASQEQPGHKSHATDSVFPPDFCITAQQQKSEHRSGMLEQS